MSTQEVPPTNETVEQSWKYFFETRDAAQNSPVLPVSSLNNSVPYNARLRNPVPHVGSFNNPGPPVTSFNNPVPLNNPGPRVVSSNNSIRRIGPLNSAVPSIDTLKAQIYRQNELLSRLEEQNKAYKKALDTEQKEHKNTRLMSEACNQALDAERQAHENTQLAFEEVTKKYYQYSLAIDQKIKSMLRQSNARVALQRSVDDVSQRLACSEEDQAYLRDELRRSREYRRHEQEAIKYFWKRQKKRYRRQATCSLMQEIQSYIRRHSMSETPSSQSDDASEADVE